jgi:hypothetical protein
LFLAPGRRRFEHEQPGRPLLVDVANPEGGQPAPVGQAVPGGALGLDGGDYLAGRALVETAADYRGSAPRIPPGRPAVLRVHSGGHVCQLVVLVGATWPAAAVIGHQPVLVGASDYLAETYQQAVSLGTFSALDLASRLGLTAQNINNRLKRLVDAAAVRRRRIASGHAGKEFTYTAPAPCALPG